jgi:cytochrome c oxidase subunit 2
MRKQNKKSYGLFLLKGQASMKNKVQKELAACQARQKKIRALTFGIVVVLVLGAAGYLLVSAFSNKMPSPAANTIDVSADMGGFSMQEMRVKAGQPVNVRLTSLDNSHHTDGGGQHQWAVDEFGMSVIAPPSLRTSPAFTPFTAISAAADGPIQLCRASSSSRLSL